MFVPSLPTVDMHALSVCALAILLLAMNKHCSVVRCLFRYTENIANAMSIQIQQEGTCLCLKETHRIGMA